MYTNLTKQFLHFQNYIKFSLCYESSLIKNTYTLNLVYAMNLV